MNLKCKVFPVQHQECTVCQEAQKKTHVEAILLSPPGVKLEESHTEQIFFKS